MGTKTTLLSAARTCLLRQGYASTTVRDLVAESGTNQASINYHFGSKHALLGQALFALNEEWGALLFGVLTAPALAEAPPAAEIEDRWARVIESIQANRALWFVNFESISFAQNDEEIRKTIAQRQELSRPVLARAFAGLDESADPVMVRSVGSHYYSLLVGVALQWLTDPSKAPSARDIVLADRHTANPDR